MNNYYFTFGQSHVHPETGVAMKDYYVRVIANSYGKAREISVKKYKLKWAFINDDTYIIGTLTAGKNEEGDSLIVIHIDPFYFMMKSMIDKLRAGGNSNGIIESFIKGTDVFDKLRKDVEDNATS